MDPSDDMCSGPLRPRGRDIPTARILGDRTLDGIQSCSRAAAAAFGECWARAVDAGVDAAVTAADDEDAVVVGLEREVVRVDDRCPWAR